MEHIVQKRRGRVGYLRVRRTWSGRKKHDVGFTVREILLECFQIRIVCRHGIGEEMVDIEWNTQEVAQPQSDPREMFLQDISLMEARQAMLEIECGVEKEKATDPSVPVLPT